MVIQEKFEGKKYAKSSNGDKQNGRFKTHFACTSNAEKCCFCGEDEDHVVAKSTKDTQIVQYFACKKFAAFLKPPTNRPPSIDHLPTDQPTTDHRPTDRRPVTPTTDQPTTDQ